MIIPRHGCAMFRLTRAQRRELKKLSARVDRVTEADRLFFERFPHRQYRVRITSRVEIARQELIDGLPMTIPPGYRWFIVHPQHRPRLSLVSVCAEFGRRRNRLGRDHGTRNLRVGGRAVSGCRGATAQGRGGAAMIRRTLPQRRRERNLRPAVLEPVLHRHRRLLSRRHAGRSLH